MGLSKAFGSVSKTVLWAAPYKAGDPAQTILHIRRGRNRTTIQAKYNKQYGKINNNVGVSHGSATSALLFIIYLRDVMGDYNAINYIGEISYRAANRRDGKENSIRTYKNTQPETSRKSWKKGAENEKANPHPN